MWRTRNPKAHEEPIVCAHGVTRTGSNAGIERVVCEACGHVSIRYIEDVIIDDIVLSDEAEANAISH